MILFANRIAPIQISYLGYLGTIGGSYFMDYLIADKTIIPDEYRPFYDEKIIYLPSYQMNDRKRPRPIKEVSKTSLGIPEDHFVFACLNNSFKYNPEIFHTWLHILESIPKSSLLLYGKNETVIKNLKSLASDAHIDPNRIIFLTGVPYEEYLSCLKVIDLFLDTTIYNAGTTASDALWMGVPVLTCIGKSFSGRVAASVLNACNMPNMITTSLTDYTKLAIKVASDQHYYQQIKNQLSFAIQDCMLFDSNQTAKSIEKAYQIAWGNYQAQSPIADINIDNLIM
jgi:predicted O-linked N-acetylglucosamine transferase (SPINDLY family)